MLATWNLIKPMAMAAAAVTVADSAVATMENHQHGSQGRESPAPGAWTQSALTGPGGGRARGVPHARREMALHCGS